MRKLSKNKIKVFIIICVLLIIPFFYVLFFLKAFWDPYENMSYVPVAIVNLDNGEYGNKIVDSLEKSHIMKVDILESDYLAKEGVKNRKYYSSITIPKNFSKNILELKENELIFRTNKKYNYIASQIYEQAANTVKMTLEKEISNAIVEKLHSGIDLTSSNVKLLNNGLYLLDKGSIELNSGMNLLNTSYTKFNDGINDLNIGLNTFNIGITEYISGVDKAAYALDLISNGVILLGDKLGILKLSSDFQKLYNGAKTIQNENIKNKLLDAGKKVKNGTADLRNGASTLYNASNSIKFALNKIENGTIQLKDGLNIANRSVSESVDKSNKSLRDIKNLDTFVSNSIKLNIENIDYTDNYGVTFATYFISISLWVGSLVMIVVMFYDAKSRFFIFDRNYSNKKLQYISYLSLICIQSLILSLLITSVFDFKLLNFKIFMLSMLIVDLAFFSLIYLFVFLFDDVGKFISVMLLIIQISASAGTFPIETTPKLFQKMFPFIPMRYSINVFKDSLAGFDKHFYIPNILVLLSIFVVSSILILISIILKTKTKDN